MDYLTKFTHFDPLTIVCIGDSTTSQEWCHPNWYDWLNYSFRQNDNWPNGWQRKLINSGRDGGTLYDFLTNFESEIARFNPDVLIVSLGFNHLELAADPATLERDVRALFTKINQLSAHIICWSTYAVPIPVHSQKLELISQLYQRICKDFDATFIDIYTEFNRYDLSKLFTFISEGNDEWHIQPGEIDYLHCNELGNQIIAQLLAAQGFNIDLPAVEGYGTMQWQDLSPYRR